MLRGSDIIGIPVSFSGENVNERIANSILDLQTNEMVGFLLTEGGWAGGARILLWDSIGRISRNSLHVSPVLPVIDIGGVMRAKYILEDKIQVIGLQVITRQGQLLGEILDFYFDEVDGKILGFDVSDGVIERNFVFIPTKEPLKIVNGFVIPTNAILSEIYMEGSSFMNLNMDLNPKEQLGEAVGHRVQYDVRDDEEYIIAARDQMVTESILKATREAHQELEMLQATGLLP